MFVRFVITIALVTNSAELAVDISQISVALTRAAAGQASFNLMLEEPDFLEDYREYLSDQWDSADKPKKKSGFMARLEEAQKAQEQQAKQRAKENAKRRR